MLPPGQLSKALHTLSHQVLSLTVKNTTNKFFVNEKDITCSGGSIGAAARM